LVGCACISGPVKEEFMRKKHVASEVHNMTLCGHETTYQEFQKMKQLNSRYVNCKRCLHALQLRELIEDGEV
jgi:hypothetical protein